MNCFKNLLKLLFVIEVCFCKIASSRHTEWTYLPGFENQGIKLEYIPYEESELQYLPNQGSESQSLRNQVSEIPSFPPLEHQEDVTRIQESQISFTRDLYTTIANQIEGNIFISPFSIGVALTMAYLGSDGNTEAEMRSVMSLPEDRNSTMRGFGEILRDLKSNSENYTLKITNRMYVSHVLSMLDEYKNTLTQGFGSIPETVDFSQSEAVRQSINAAIENDTNSKIKDLIPEGMLDEYTRLVLTNAIYFNGFWDAEFNPNHTISEPFWISKESSVDVDMMNRKGSYPNKYDHNLMSTVLKLTYKGGRMSMIVVLPDEESDVRELEQKLTKDVMQNLDTGLNLEPVRLSFPKFKIEIETELNDFLNTMGMTSAFSHSANFNKITPKAGLSISKVIHKAFLEVNEEGSEAAAATAITLFDKSISITYYKPIKVNRPFIFFIKDSKTGQILFNGRITSPK